MVCLEYHAAGVVHIEPFTSHEFAIKPILDLGEVRYGLGYGLAALTRPMGTCVWGTLVGNSEACGDMRTVEKGRMVSHHSFVDSRLHRSLPRFQMVNHKHQHANIKVDCAGG